MKPETGEKEWTACHCAGVLLLAALLVDGGIMRPAHAQAAGVQETRHFHIPAQPLAGALVQFGLQSGLQIVADGQMIATLRTSGVNGNLSPATALTQLLAGTGMRFRFLDSRSARLERAPAGAAITLGAVRVAGHVRDASDAGQAPYGPGEGFVATRSTSATKTDTPIVAVPHSIYVVGRQQLDDLQPLTITEALRYMPGISAPNGGGGLPVVNTHDIYQRGFQSDTFVDGLMTGVSPSTVEPFMMDRIEALSGPASVMYGQAAPGGIINVSLKRPTEKAQHQFNVGFGSYGRYEGQLDTSGPLTKSGNLLYRLVAIGNTQGDQTKYNHYKRIVVQPSLTWKPDDKTDLTFIGQYNWTPVMDSSQMVPAAGQIFPGKFEKFSPHIYMGDPGFTDSYTNSYFFEYIFNHKFNRFLKFSQNFRYEHSHDLFAALFPQQLQPGTSIVGRTGAVDGSKGFSALLDNHLQGDFSTGPVKHTVLIGYDFRVQETSSYYRFGAPAPSLDLHNPVYYQYSYADFMSYVQQKFNGKWNGENDYLSQSGIYFQDQFTWKNLHVMLGGRQDWNSWYDQFKKAFTWHAGASYVFDFGLAPYFSYATSFNPQAGNIYGAGQAAPLVGKQWEVGLKYQPPHTQLLFTAAAYDLRENNVLVTDPDHQGFSRQVGQVRVRGVDLSANANLAQGLNLSATYSYMYPENSRSNLTSVGYTGETASIQGKMPTSLPRNTVSLLVDYKLPKNIIPGLSVNAGLRYIGSTAGDEVNSFKVPAYTVFDGGATYDFGAISEHLKGLNMRLSMVNAFNKEYISSCSSSYYCSWGQLRRVYGSVGYRW